MEMVRYPPLTVLGVAAATVFSLYCALDFYGDQTQREQASSDPLQMSMQEKRFEAVKHELPPGTVVGYVSDLPASSGIILSAQYALVPVILGDGMAHEFVIGNFSKPQDFAAFGRARNLTLVRDFGDGVTLFRNARP